MKKTVFAIMALLAPAVVAMAQNALSVADVTLPQNGEATLTVSYQFDVADSYTGYQFELALPGELSFAMEEGTDVACVKGACHDASHSVTANLSDGVVKVAGLSLSSKPLTGTSGELLTFTIKPTSTLTIGQTFTGTIQNAIIVPVEGTKLTLEDGSFTITIGEPVDTRKVLDETSTVVPEAAAGVDVRVKRSISAGSWNTICLPFAMTAAQVKSAFGNDVQLGDFSGWSSEENDEGDVVGITVKFQNVTAMEANHPYIVKVSSAVSEFTADGVDIAPEDEPTVQVGQKKAERGYFIGTYVANTTVPKEDLFLSGNKFWYSNGSTEMKAFRGYFEFADVLAEIEAAAPAISIVFDNATGIETIAPTLQEGREVYYNLSGQRVEQPGKGLYIKNGKKAIMK